MPKTKQLLIGVQYRAQAQVVQNSFNTEAGTFDITFATETPVLRCNWDENYSEVLLCDKKNVRMGRVDAGISLLDSHPDRFNPVVKPENVMGKISNVRFENKSMVGTVTLGAQCSDATRADLISGILDTFSVGYSIYKGIREEDTVTNTVTYKMTDWEPNHVAIAPIPADINSTMRSNDTNQNTFFIENNLKNETNMFKTIEEIRAGGTAEDKSRIEAIVGICRSAQLDDARAMELFSTEKTLDAIRSENPAKTPVNVVNIEGIRSQATADRRIRLDSILKSTRAAGMEDSRAIDFFNGENTVEEIRQSIIDDFVKRDPKPAPHLGESGIEKKVRGIENAMLHRSNPSIFKLEEGGNEFRGMSLLEIGKEILVGQGVNVRGKDKQEIAQLIIMGQHRDMSTSDFPLILENVLNKSLRADYQLAEEYWGMISRETSVNDFKAKAMYQIDSSNGMKKLPEGDEIKYGSMKEAKQTIAVETFAEGLILTRKMIINDDMSAFERIPQKFVTDWDLLRGDMVWNMLTANVKMDDGKTLFHADHANLSGSGSALSEASLTAAVLAMKKQTGIAGKTLRVVPKLLVVSPENEITARKLLAVIAPTQSSSVNVFSTMNITLIVEHRLSGNAWFLAADPAAIDGLYHAYLSGNGGLRANREDNFNTQGIKFAVAAEFGVAAIDYRGWYKNAGQ